MMKTYIILTIALIHIRSGTSQSATCPQNNKYNKMFIHQKTVYIAGTRCICKADLNLENKVCAEGTNFGLVKVFLQFDKRLIICGSENNGTCQIRKMKDLYSFILYNLLPDASQKTSTSVATDSNDRRTIAFTGAGGDNKQTVLYTASHQRRDNPQFVLLSVRSLEKGKEFQLFKQNDLGSQIELTSNETVRKEYYKLFDPRGGFTNNGFAYFFANQLNVVGKDPVAKIIRICQNDEGRNKMLTYSDAVFVCGLYGDILIDVLLVPVGSSSRTVWKDEYIFLGIFKNSTQHVEMCTYDFGQVTKVFKTARRVVESSYLVVGSQAGDDTHNRNETGCNERSEYRNFIAKTLYKLGSSKSPLPVEDNITYTTVSLINKKRHTLVLIAANNHFITRIFIGKKEPYKLEPIMVMGDDVQSMSIVDDYVIILNSTGISRHLLYYPQKCLNFTSNYTCLNQQDPFCGWCLESQLCTGMTNCSSKWIPISLGDFKLESFSPKLGPMAGGTKIIFTGQNLFAIEDGLEILIGNKTCLRVEVRNETTLECLTPDSASVQEVNVSYTLKTLDTTAPQHLHVFMYKENPVVSGISPNRSFESGGINLTVTGQNFEVIQNPRIQVIGANISESCDHSNNSVIVCKAPEATPELKEMLENQIEATTDRRRGTDDNSVKPCENEDVLCVDVEFQMDGVDTSLLRQTLEYARDPVFYNFTEHDMTKDYYRTARDIAIQGDRINVAASVHDFSVAIGTGECLVVAKNFTRYQFHCVPPSEEPQTLFYTSQNPEVKVTVGNIHRHVGFLRYQKANNFNIYLAIALGILVAMVMVLVLIGTMLWRRNRRAVKKLQTDMELMEVRIQTEFRQAFADLQTDMTDITGELVETGLPYNKFPVYAFQILFPADDVRTMTSHKVFTYPETTHDVTDVDTAMSELDGLFQNKFFVLSVIDTLEQQKTLSLSEKSNFAAFLASVLISDLDYFSQLVKLLTQQQVTASVMKKKHKSLYRRCVSITEKLTSLWLEIVLHQHILKSRGGSSLIMLVKAIQTVMLKSPIDAVTDAARATLSYEQLLLAHVDNDKTIHLTVQINDGDHESKCSVLECDTISQVKDKCLRIIYKRDPFSLRPKTEDVDIQWHCGKQGRLILKERDTVPADDNDVKLMTLADYHVTNGSVVELLNKTPSYDEDFYVNYGTILQHQSNSDVLPLVDDEESEIPKKETKTQVEARYHLVKPETEGQERNKMWAEVNLHKLLQTKLNVKQYVDEAIDSALDKKDIPVVVKFIFSVLEELASSLGVDQETLLSWKNNCYPIRFWGLLISRPNIVFDIDVPDYLQPSLDIVASTFMDSFTSPQTLSKNSAPHKLLFFKDLEEYRSMVKSFHRAVNNTPVVDDRQLAQELTKLTYVQSFRVNTTSVYFELFKVLIKYKEEILNDLEEGKNSSRLGLAEKLGHVIEILDC